MSKGFITSAAYLEEMDVWQSSLKGSIKRLLSLQKSGELPPAFQNEIQILVTEMQSQLLKYRREKTKIASLRENTGDFSDIIKHYETLNQRHVQFLQRVNQATSQFGYSGSAQEIRYTTNRQIDNRSTSKASKSRVNSTKKNNKSTKVAKNWQEIQRPHVRSFQQSRHFRKPQQPVVESTQCDLRLEFVSLKNKISQLYKLVDTHEHPLLEQQINKLKLSNSKILMDLKVIKEEHAYMQSQIFQIKKQLVQQKKKQTTSRQRPLVLQEKPQLARGQNVPEWVKVRVANRH